MGRTQLGLTPRELEIARLATAGLTRREIASRLYITENSVKTHLEHVYGKLGVRNRLEMEHKLPPPESLTRLSSEPRGRASAASVPFGP